MDTVLASGNEAVIAFLDAAGAFDAISHKFIDEALKRAFGDDLGREAASAAKTDFEARKLRRLVRDFYAKACDRIQVRKTDWSKAKIRQVALGCSVRPDRSFTCGG